LQSPHKDTLAAGPGQRKFQTCYRHNSARFRQTGPLAWQDIETMWLGTVIVAKFGTIVEKLIRNEKGPRDAQPLDPSEPADLT